MLDPTYDKIRAKVMSNLESDAPKTIALSLDGWTQHHNGYFGINIHYIHDWRRKSVNLATTACQ